RLEAEARERPAPGPRIRQLKRETDGHADAPDRVAPRMGSGTRPDAREGEGGHARTRRARGRAAQNAVARGRQGIPLRRADRRSEPGRPVRGSAPADRLPSVLRAGSTWVA